MSDPILLAARVVHQQTGRYVHALATQSQNFSMVAEGLLPADSPSLAEHEKAVNKAKLAYVIALDEFNEITKD